MNDQLYLKPDEKKFIAMAVLSMLEDLEDTSKNPKINWTPSARKDLTDMLSTGNHLRVKMEKLGFDMRDLPPYLDSDQDEFFTKQS